MGFTFVTGQDDYVLEDAVRRGVADGLARMLGVPKHPDSVQAMLDSDARAREESVNVPVQATAGTVRTTR
ncbi:hypothetical protein [Methylobacterium sp. E-046]|uniref:hypothetical protein n=1 Tax=Methylobacterium sp. E-046 TaxID=2836576 RepID=UPI001FBBC508|nr:hypothetical protein [Methylobacterium sp. E-046]